MNEHGLRPDELRFDRRGGKRRKTNKQTKQKQRFFNVTFGSIHTKPVNQNISLFYVFVGVVRQDFNFFFNISSPLRFEYSSDRVRRFSNVCDIYNVAKIVH